MFRKTGLSVLAYVLIVVLPAHAETMYVAQLTKAPKNGPFVIDVNDNGWIITSAGIYDSKGRRQKIAGHRYNGYSRFILDNRNNIYTFIKSKSSGQACLARWRKGKRACILRMTASDPDVVRVTNDGLVLGTAYFEGVEKSFTYKLRTLSVLPVPTGYSSFSAQSINSSHTIVGVSFPEGSRTYSDRVAFIFKNGQYEKVVVPGTTAYSVNINDAENILYNSYELSDRSSMAYTLRTGTIHKLPVAPRCKYCTGDWAYGAAMLDDNSVIGASNFSTIYWSPNSELKLLGDFIAPHNGKSYQCTTESGPKVSSGGTIACRAYEPSTNSFPNYFLVLRPQYSSW